MAETFFSDPKSITNKKWGEKKDPYCQEVASKLDSATDISKLRLSNQPLEMADSLAIFPNDDVSRYAVSFILSILAVTLSLKRTDFCGS